MTILNILKLFSNVYEKRYSKNKLNKKKCTFGSATIEYLERMVCLNKVEPGVVKVKAMLDFPTSVNRKKLFSFLGQCSYFRKYIPARAHVAAYLTGILK